MLFGRKSTPCWGHRCSGVLLSRCRVVFLSPAGGTLCTTCWTMQQVQYNNRCREHRVRESSKFVHPVAAAARAALATHSSSILEEWPSKMLRVQGYGREWSTEPERRRWRVGSDWGVKDAVASHCYCVGEPYVHTKRQAVRPCRSRYCRKHTAAH